VIDDPWAPVVSAAIANTKENTNVATTEEAFTITLKQSGGYESPWVVIRSGSAEEAKARLQEATESGLFDAVNQAVGSFAGKPTVKAAFQQPATQQNFPTPTPPAASSGPSETCKHGEMNFKSGVNQNTGKAWKGHFCPTPKGTPDQCRPVFF